MLRPTRKQTIDELRSLKGKRRLTHLPVKSPEEAAEEDAPAEAPADAAASGAEGGDEAVAAEEEKEPEPAMTAEDAQGIVDKVADLEAQLEKAIEEEDFGACGGLNAELEGLAAKKAEAEALLKA